MRGKMGGAAVSQNAEETTAALPATDPAAATEATPATPEELEGHRLREVAITHLVQRRAHLKEKVEELSTAQQRLEDVKKQLAHVEWMLDQHEWVDPEIARIAAAEEAERKRAELDAENQHDAVV
jgi:ABC-type Zn2+ transport system substrate-binding protein/surface adhesin